MASWRDKLAKAKARIHAEFEVPAVYLTHAAGTPLRLNIRVHTKQHQIDAASTWANGAGLLDLEPTLIFRQADLPNGKVVQDAFVFVSASEIYRTGPSDKATEGFIRVRVSDASSSDVAEVTALLEANGYGPEWEGVYP